MEELLLNNNTVTEVAEEVVEAGLTTDFMKGFGAGVLGTAVAVTAYKYAVKPLAKKVKAKIAAKKAAKAAEEVVSEQ